MSKPDSRVYFEKVMPLEQAYVLGSDPRPLHVAFGQLFDEAAQAVSMAGSDLDEVLVERIVVAGDSTGKCVEVAAEFLADVERLKFSVLQNCIRAGLLSSADAVRVVGVRLIARHDPPPIEHEQY